MACEDGSEGFSDLYQENAMLQRESDTLRLRVKAMQETIDHLNTRVTHLLANEVSTLLTKSSTWLSLPPERLVLASSDRLCGFCLLTSVCLSVCTWRAGEGNQEIGCLIQNYIREVEELR